MVIKADTSFQNGYIISVLKGFTFRFSKLRTFFSTVCNAKFKAESLDDPIASVEDMLEAELPLELEDETSDADGIVAIEKMRMARTKLFFVKTLCHQAKRGVPPAIWADFFVY